MSQSNLKLKVCGMRDPQNIKDLMTEIKPDLMGLIFYKPSKRFVEQTADQSKLIKTLPIEKVGVFVDATIEEVSCKIEKYQLSFVQLHGNESVSFCRDLKRIHEVKIIKVFALKMESDLDKVKAYEGEVDAFLFDTPSPDHGGTGMKWDWNILESYDLKTPIWLSGGIDLESIESIKNLNKILPIVGIDVNSKFEISPALKDIEKLKEINLVL